MDRQEDFTSRLVDIGDDVGDEGAQELLAGTHCDVRRVPRGVEVGGKPGKVRRGGDRIKRSRHLFESGSTRLDTAQRRFPTFFQLRRNQPIVGIAGGVPAFGQ